MIEVENFNPLVLAYIGDGCYELYVRNFLINKNIVKVKELQTEAIKFVSAVNQSKFLEQLISLNILDEIEMSIVMRTRNHKVNHKPRNVDILTYKHATALEALVGYLYLSNKKERLDYLMSLIIR
ncbi:MAG: ribonuclease III domain-containing protein [Bacilli bacterium]|nr:ribonuclease III domain-containing protein [Bacilli bacterium]MDD4733503.1 ribonuclease III domain-containing protein [Bacilli bacterium]